MMASMIEVVRLNDVSIVISVIEQVKAAKDSQSVNHSTVLSESEREGGR